MDNFKVILEAVIDNSSLTNAQKKIAKEHFAASLDIELDVDSFAKQKKALSQNIDEMSKHFKKAFDKLQFKVDDKQLLSFTQEFFSEINKVAKAQEKLNELTKKQEQTEFLSKQTSFYRDIIKNQEDIYSLKKRLLSADELETEEIKKQIEALESRNKANRDSLTNNSMVDSSWDKIVQESKEALENQYRLTEARKVDGTIAKEIATEEKERTKALEFTRKESEKLASAIQKYSYGDSSSANDMMKQLNRGVGNFSDLSSVDKEITKISSNVDKIIDGLKRSHEQSLKALNSAINAEEKATKHIQPSIDNGAYSTQIDKLVSQFQKYGLSVDEAEEKVKELRTTLLSMETAPSNESLVSDYQKWEQQIKDVNVQLDQAKLKSEQIAKVNEIQHSLDVGDYEAQIETVKKGFVTLSGNADEAENHVKRLRDALKSMHDATDDNAKILAEKNYRLELEKTQNQLTISKAKAKEYVDVLKVNKLRNDIQDWLKKNTAATKEARDAMQSYLNMLNGDKISPIDFNTAKDGMDYWDTEMRKMGKLGKSLTETFKQGAKSFLEWTLSSGAVMELIQVGRKAINNVIELDNQLLELDKVSDLTAEGLRNVTDEAYELGEKVGKTGTQVLGAVTEFKRAGYELEESMNMAESALVMTNVAEGITETSDAAGTLISVLKGFKMDDSQIGSIVDKMNQVSNTSPIGFDELADGLERVSGTMNQAGNTIDQTLGLLTGGYAQLRNIEKVSSGMIFIQQRLRGIDEDGNEIEGLSAKLKDSFAEIGVAVENSDGSLRSMYEIATDYAKVLPNLTSKQKQYYGELAAGNRQITVWNAITEQIADVEHATAQSIDSVGSASVENAKYLDSISGKVSQFESKFEDLSDTVLDSELVKGTVGFGTGFLSFLDGIFERFGTLSTITTVASGIFGAKGLGLTNYVA